MMISLKHVHKHLNKLIPQLHGALLSQLLRPPYELCRNDGPDGGNGTPLGKKPVEVADKSGARIGLTLRNCVWPEPLASPAAKNTNMKTTLVKTNSSVSNVVGLLEFISKKIKQAAK
ncbi:hypothetical protein ACET3Z_015059 [Daucus carota]